MGREVVERLSWRVLQQERWGGRRRGGGGQPLEGKGARGAGGCCWHLGGRRRRFLFPHLALFGLQQLQQHTVLMLARAPLILLLLSPPPSLCILRLKQLHKLWGFGWNSVHQSPLLPPCPTFTPFPFVPTCAACCCKLAGLLRLLRQ